MRSKQIKRMLQNLAAVLRNSHNNKKARYWESVNGVPIISVYGVRAQTLNIVYFKKNGHFKIYDKLSGRSIMVLPDRDAILDFIQKESHEQPRTEPKKARRNSSSLIRNSQLQNKNQSIW